MADITLRLESSRIRSILEATKVDSIITSSRIRADLEFHNYLNRNYVIELADYFAEDFVEAL